jgi:2-keto-4-pentenoate hydratase/2-oxohepta-3-ene-1,7-dioic acid hydratase in catechol pathway
MLVGDEVADLEAADAAIGGSMLALIAAGEQGLARVRAAADTAPRLAAASVRIGAPIPRPPKNIFCVGKNYHEHAKEFQASGFDSTSSGQASPDQPIIFTKPWTAIIGPGDPIPAHLDPTGSVDYENELAVVIGRGGRGIARAAALDHVFGYTIVNDVTSRTLQQQHKQWFIGKSIDGFCPMGPAILTADAVPDVRDLRVTTRVNGEVRQDASVRDLIFDIPTLIEAISRTVTLEPGDIIATGTPAGVGIGFDPPRFLKEGDIVTCAISGIGELENVVG